MHHRRNSRDPKRCLECRPEPRCTEERLARFRHHHHDIGRFFARRSRRQCESGERRTARLPFPRYGQADGHAGAPSISHNRVDGLHCCGRRYDLRHELSQPPRILVIDDGLVLGASPAAVGPHSEGARTQESGDPGPHVAHLELGEGALGHGEIPATEREVVDVHIERYVSDERDHRQVLTYSVQRRSQGLPQLR